MDIIDIDSTLKELDDLDAELFGDTLKKVPGKKAQETDDATSKRRISQSSIDDFDDDINDLLSDDSPPRSKGSKLDVKAKESSIDADHKQRTNIFELPENTASKGSPKHGKVISKGDEVTDIISKGNVLDSPVFSKGLSLESKRKTSIFESTLHSPVKTSEKNENRNFASKKSIFAAELGFDTPANSKNAASKNEIEVSMQKSKEVKGNKDEVNFDDSELLDDLGFDDLEPKKPKVKQRSNSVEKSRSFMDDLFGGPKNEPNVATQKQQDFILDEKYKIAETKAKSEELGFGSYVPSSAVASGPTSRRKSVKFDDDIVNKKISAPIKKQGSHTREDNFLDTLLSPKHRINADDEAAQLAKSLGFDDPGYENSKQKINPLLIEKRVGESLNANKVDNLGGDTPTVSKAKSKNLDWLGFSKEDEKQEKQRLPRDRSLGFLDDPKDQNKEKSLTERRRSSGADWLGINASKKKENASTDIFQVTDKKNDAYIKSHSQEKVTDGSSSDNFIKSAPSGPHIKQQEKANLVSAKATVMNPLDANMGAQNVNKLNFQKLQDTSAHAVIASKQVALSTLQSFPKVIPEPFSSPNFQVQQLPYNGSQNEFVSLQVMINNLQLEKDQLLKAVDSMKLKHAEEIETIKNSQKNEIKVADESHQNQEKRLKEEYEAQIHSLKSQMQSFTAEKSEAVEIGRQRIVDLEKEYNKEIRRLKDLHSQAIAAMKLDHEDALSRLKRLKDQEVEAISSTQVYARSLQHLTEQLEARTAELGSLQIKVDGRHEAAIKERETLLDIKEKELKDLKKRLERQLEESDEERSRLQQLVLRLESRIQLQAKEGEEENWNLQQTKAKLDVQKKILDEERNQAFQQIERDKGKLHLSQESLLHEQKTILLQLAQERQQLSSEKMELDILSKRLKDEEAKLTMARIRDEANIEIRKSSFLKEKENLQAERSQLRQEIQQLQIDKEQLEKQNIELQTEREKLNDIKFTLQRKSQELEEINRNAKRLKEEAKLALTSSNRMEREHQMQKDNLSRQLMSLREKETQVLLEKNTLEGEKRFLEKKRNSFLCANCNLSLTYPVNASTSDVNIPRLTSSVPFASFGVLSGIANSNNTDQNLMWWYVTAQKDREYLVNEQEFLQSLKETSKGKQELF